MIILGSLFIICTLLLLGEAAGVAVVYAIPVGYFVYKGLTRENFFPTLRYAGTTIGVVMLMVFMVLIVSRFLVFEDIPGMAEDLVYSISENPVIILLMVNLVMILIGMLMDDVSGLLLSAPLLLPIVQSVGMDPVHFAAVLGVNSAWRTSPRRRRRCCIWGHGSPTRRSTRC